MLSSIFLLVLFWSFAGLAPILYWNTLDPALFGDSWK